MVDTKQYALVRASTGGQSAGGLVHELFVVKYSGDGFPALPGVAGAYAHASGTDLYAAKHLLSSKLLERGWTEQNIAELFAGTSKQKNSFWVTWSSAESPNSTPLPLQQLDPLDLPEARTLLAELRSLATLAENVDRARGRIYPDVPEGVMQGTNYAETLHQLVCRLQLEISGPEGRE